MSLGVHVSGWMTGGYGFVAFDSAVFALLFFDDVSFDWATL